MRPTDHRDIFVRLHPFSTKKKALHSAIYTRFDDVIFIRPITASLVCPYKPSNAFWGVVLTTPPTFELTNQSAPFSHVVFALDQSECSIFPLTNQNADRKVSLWCAYHYFPCSFMTSPPVLANSYSSFLFIYRCFCQLILMAR